MTLNAYPFPVAVVSEALTGTSVNAYADALDWKCYGYPDKNIHLKNTHGANALDYKVLTYVFIDNNEIEEVVETELAHGDTAQIVLEHAYAQVKVQVKSSVGDSHATYELDYVGSRRG